MKRFVVLVMSGFLSFAVRRLPATLLLLCALSLPASAATLRGTVYDAFGVSDLSAGGQIYDLTFHNARSGSWFDTFQTTDVTPAITDIDSAAEARTVLSAFQSFLAPLGPVQMNNGQNFLVMAFGSSFGNIQYLTTATGSNNYGGVYGAFEVDAVDDTFYRTVSFVTAKAQPAPGAPSQGAAFRTAAPALTPVPGPSTGLALIGALGFGAWVLRRKR